MYTAEYTDDGCYNEKQFKIFAPDGSLICWATDTDKTVDCDLLLKHLNRN